MKSSLSTKKRGHSGSTPKKEKKQRYRYVYCIVPANAGVDELQVTGVDGTKVYAIGYKDYIAIVSDSASREHEILDNGVSHQKVVEAVQEYAPVLPMGFGQVASEREIRTFLERNSYRCKMLFNKYAGKKQLGVKAFWDMDAILEEIGDSNDQVRIMRKQIESKPAPVAHKMKMKAGQKVADELETRGTRIASNIIRRLDVLAGKSKKNKNLNKEMFLNAVFLVADENEKKFDETLDALDLECGETVNLKYTVSAPYDFISLRIR